MADYLEPLSDAFFARGPTLAESVREHLALVLQTPRGSFPADPLFGCDLGVGTPAMASAHVIEDIRRAILHADRRVATVGVRLVGPTADAVGLELEVRIRPPAQEVLRLKAQVTFVPRQVRVERG